MTTLHVPASPDLATVVLATAQRTRRGPQWPSAATAWGWDDDEGRAAHLHTAMTLRALAARIRVERAQSGPLQSVTQHALADCHAAFRALEALLAPLPAEIFDRAPTPDQETLRALLAQLNRRELAFLATIRAALGSEDGVAPIDNRVEFAAEPMAAQAWTAIARAHARVLQQLVGLTDTQAERAVVLWEARRSPILFHIWRLGAHVRAQAVQVHATLAALGVHDSAADLYVRDLYAALAEVEGARLGAGTVGRAACALTAAELDARYAAAAHE